jgi:hypothetical protein
VIGAWTIHGHAIVSSDDRIADATGLMPPALRNEADWRRFQKALDAAAVTVLGRLGHEANPNLARRNRLVLTGSVKGVGRRAGVWWWNPASAPVEEALARAAPGGGTAAIVGGRRIFDLFLDFGYDAFDLARAGTVLLPGGVPLFSAIAPGSSAAALLAAHGLVAGQPQVIDNKAEVSLTLWRRPSFP